MLAALRRYLLVSTLLLAGLLSGCLVGLSLAGAAGAHRIGPIPPDNPAADCTGWGLAAIDACRAREGVGPLVLPSNWTRLTVDRQLLVLIDLERVNRGLPAIPVIVTALDALAQTGAEKGTEPAFPPSGCDCFTHGGAIWASAEPPSVFEADELWMYDDAGSHWGHRDNILMAGADLVGGAGANIDNWDFEILAGYPAMAREVTFRWSAELRYFAHRPGLEPLRR